MEAAVRPPWAVGRPRLTSAPANQPAQRQPGKRRVSDDDRCGPVDPQGRPGSGTDGVDVVLQGQPDPDRLDAPAPPPDAMVDLLHLEVGAHPTRSVHGAGAPAADLASGSPPSGSAATTRATGPGGCTGPTPVRVAPPVAPTVSFNRRRARAGTGGTHGGCAAARHRRTQQRRREDPARALRHRRPPTAPPAPGCRRRPRPRCRTANPPRPGTAAAVNPSRSIARRYGCGSGLPLVDLVAADGRRRTGARRAGRQRDVDQLSAANWSPARSSIPAARIASISSSAPGCQSRSSAKISAVMRQQQSTVASTVCVGADVVEHQRHRERHRLTGASRPWSRAETAAAQVRGDPVHRRPPTAVRSRPGCRPCRTARRRSSSIALAGPRR